MVKHTRYGILARWWSNFVKNDLYKTTWFKQFVFISLTHNKTESEGAGISRTVDSR